MDYSFLKLFDSIDDSISDDLFKNSQLQYYTMIQLSPNETYLQMTNYDSDLDLSNDFTCEVIDGCGNVLSDITSNVFTESYVDTEGLTQTKIEYVNLGVDYFGRAVHIRFSVNSSNKKYYTRPIKITNKDILKTYRFDYSNPTNMNGFSYESAGVYQSIRLWLKPKGYSNQTEVSDYYQISTGNNISLRPLRQLAKNFLTENIDGFIFVRLQEMLLHNEVYLDGERITNKPILEPDDRIGESNLFRSNFTANINTSDTFTPGFQVFDGLNLMSLSPIGTLNICDTGTNLEATFNIPIEIGIGTLMLYDAFDDSLVHTWDQDDCYLSNAFTLSVSGLSTYVEASTNYYIIFSSGLVTAIGVVYEGFNDTTTWAFNVVDGEYDEDEYNNDEYVVGCNFVGRIHNDLFNDTYN